MVRGFWMPYVHWWEDECFVWIMHVQYSNDVLPQALDSRSNFIFHDLTDLPGEFHRVVLEASARARHLRKRRAHSPARLPRGEKPRPWDEATAAQKPPTVAPHRPVPVPPLKHHTYSGPHAQARAASLASPSDLQQVRNHQRHSLKWWWISL